MTPKEKAGELLRNMTFGCKECDYEKNAIESALTTVDYILESFDSFMDSRKNFRHELEINAERYWVKVREEIEKL